MMRSVLLMTLGGVVLALAGCSATLPTITPSGATPTPGPGPVPTINLAAVPEPLQQGAKLFEQNCARCHGADARGTQTGPPFISPIYVPGHHPDQAFVNAAHLGVSAHHWGFGNMAPVPGVSDDDVLAIVRYVRHVQRQAGLIE